MDHPRTDQSSIRRFIEDDWQTSGTGNFCFNDKTGNLNDLFTFTDPPNTNKQRWRRASWTQAPENPAGTEGTRRDGKEWPKRLPAASWPHPKWRAVQR